MRTAIIEEIYQQMKEDKNIYFLIGDLGYHAVEKIEQDFPERFINVGVAEQNMIGIASGLALSGKKVYIYSIIPFLIMRCFEQIRNDVCYHDLDVNFLGIGAGLTYGILSSTHFALEDVAILRALPNMTIFSPADETEAFLGIKSKRNHHHPFYIRIGARQEPKIFNKPYNFSLGKGKIIKRGNDITIFVSGTLMNEVVKAVEMLKYKRKINSTIVDLHTLKPIDRKLIIKESRAKQAVITVEEHYIEGGLGSVVAEAIAESGLGIKLLRIGLENKFIQVVGTRSYLRHYLGLDQNGIFKRISKFL